MMERLSVETDLKSQETNRYFQMVKKEKKKMKIKNGDKGHSWQVNQ